METIILPHKLPGDLDLAFLNQRLRTGEVKLDWSNVEEASETSLVSLLAGLDIAKNATVLGLETVPEHLMEALSLTFEGAQAKATRQTWPQLKQVQSPSLWTSPVQPDLFEEQEADGEELEAEPVVDLPPPPRLLQAPPPVKLREEMENLVLTDLLGPAGGPEEELDERNVRERYLIGMLAPSRRQVLPEEQDDLAVAGEDSSEEGRADTGGYATTFFPSSFGMTFCVSGDASRLHAWASWGRYERIISETLRDEKSGNPKRVWKRQPMGGVAHEVALRIGPIEAWVPDSRQPEVVVRGLVRRLADTWIVTLFLINRQHEPKNLRDSAWIFQPELRVEAPDSTPIFCRQALPSRTKRADSVAAAEKDAMAMLYRNQVEFAAGHGVGVHIETLPGVPDRAIRIMTRVAPTYEVPQTTSPTVEELPHLADLVLDMRELAETPDSDFARKLSPLTTAYAAWIAEQEERITDPAAGLADHRSAAEQAIAACTLTLARIREGISLIGTQPQAAEAFRFLNRAMWQQRIHTLAAEAVRRGNQLDLESVDVPTNRTWRPFQLAFILINVPSLSNLHHPDRSEMPSALADLLWFPTGGGKTEAYLGLTAYTLAIRRLQGTIAGRSGEEGVAVLMRYTLRLLTLQQFQRAAALICACELIRREAIARGDHRWGKTPFRLGLWVGQRTTPNRTEQSAEAVKLDHGQFRRSSPFGGSGSPAQLTNCPWCGTKIEADQHIKVDLFKQGAGRTYMYCGDPLGNCPFSQRQAPDEGLPVLVVDEEIYRRLPSLLIATVDKFAQMPWNGAVGMLFGQVNGLCTRHGFRSPDLEDSDTHPRRDFWPAARTEPHAPLRPPDLIIQDELHLISGPLGTLVGLYEAAVDRLASWEVDGQRVRPKVIASTATIRRASEQVRALFLRQVNIFPPHGLDIEDNFFSRQRLPSHSSPGRRYVGICAPGRRIKNALIRVYVAYLAAGKTLYERYGRAVDPWMTLVGYFNSIRELAGMRRLVDDDVRTRLSKMDARGMAKRQTPRLEELTSRKGSTDIPRVLDLLETVFDPADEAERAALRKAGRKVEKLQPLDVLLATNMVSVGVDVKRLGLMVVAGQPKTTAEYIQATSRVGRNFPGLVCVVYNWSRPRDLSHYEHFEQYHATFYQHVEALSVTPFAPRAIDRGLSALLISYVRLLGLDLNENARAAAISRDHPYLLQAVKDLTERARLVTGKDGVGDLVHRELEARVDAWMNEVSHAFGGRLLGYQDRKDGKTVGLLRSPDFRAWNLFTCLNSLRDVEPSVGLILDNRGMDSEPDRPLVGVHSSLQEGENS